MGQGGQLWTFAGGITALFLTLIVLQNYKGVAGILTGFGSLYGAAAKSSSANAGK